MKRSNFLVLLAVLLFLTTGFGSAAEKSLESIHQAWRSSLKGVQTYGLAVQKLDSEAKACGLDRMALANAVRSGVKDNTPLNIDTDSLQLFNIFVDVATLNASDRCTSMASLRVSALVDPSYAPLLAAEITPWSERTIVISTKENHLQAVADTLAEQAAHFAKAWREQQSR